MHDGKLYISMNDAVALALENNLDIAIARYNLNIADTDIWRAKAGAAILGVNSGVVQNTPGEGVGGLGAQVGSGQGGTSVAAGGAGAGSGGIVVSTFGSGPLINSFDPVLTGTLQIDRNNILPSSTFSPASPINTSTGKLAERVERYSARFDPRAGGDRGRARVPCAQVGARQDLPLSHSPRGHLSAVSGALCVALPLSTGGICDGCGRGRGRRQARFHIVRGGRPRAGGTNGGPGKPSHQQRPEDLLLQLGARRRRIDLYGARQRISSSHGAEPVSYTHLRGRAVAEKAVGMEVRGGSRG